MQCIQFLSPSVLISTKYITKPLSCSGHKLLFIMKNCPLDIVGRKFQGLISYGFLVFYGQYVDKVQSKHLEEGRSPQICTAHKMRGLGLFLLRKWKTIYLRLKGGNML